MYTHQKKWVFALKQLFFDTDKLWYLNDVLINEKCFQDHDKIENISKERVLGPIARLGANQ